MDEPTKAQTATEATSAAKPKQPYTPPQVVVHGTIAELTLGVQGTFPDQGPGSNLGQ